MNNFKNQNKVVVVVELALPNIKMYYNIYKNEKR